jgi:ribosomal protein S18 acetylase RimI-like enzyme
MNDLITLVGLTGHKDMRPALVPVRRLEPDDLHELCIVQRRAYADGPAQPDEGDTPPTGIPGVKGLGRTVEAATLVTSDPEGHITAAIIVTEQDGGPVIAELFTHPDYRRQGLAEELLRHAMHVLHALDHATVTVTVEESNSGAIALYLSRDFRRLMDDDPDSDYD